MSRLLQCIAILLLTTVFNEAFSGPHFELNPHTDIFHGRFRRTPNKFESLKRSEREQKLIELGAISSDIATDTPSEVRANVGDTVYLPCRVTHLGTHSINWEYQGMIMSIDTFMTTHNPRYTVSHDDDTWRLVVRSVQESDYGVYRCTVRTTPPKHRDVTLHVFPRGVSLLQDIPSQHSAGLEELRANVSALWAEMSYIRRVVAGYHQDTNQDAHQGHDIQGQGHDKEKTVQSLVENNLDGVSDDDVYRENIIDGSSNSYPDETVNNYKANNYTGNNSTGGNNFTEEIDTANGFTSVNQQYPNEASEEEDRHSSSHEGNGIGSLNGSSDRREDVHHLHGRPSRMHHRRARNQRHLTKALCVLRPNTPLLGAAVEGRVIITQRRERLPGPVHFNIDVHGFSRNRIRIADPSHYGFHIHENAVTDGDCSTAGGHFNPHNRAHGAPTDHVRHVGDLGNIAVTSSGRLLTNLLLDDLVSLTGPHNIVGRSIVVHAGEDDLGRGRDPGSRAAGNSGPRLACCTIVLAHHTGSRRRRRNKG